MSTEDPGSELPLAPPEKTPRGVVIGIVLVLVVAFGLSLAWEFTPLARVVTPQRVVDWGMAVGSYWWAPFIVLFAYTPGCLILFPRPLITLFAVIAFGPWLGATYSFGGLLVASLITYCVGARMDPQRVQARAGARLAQIMKVLRKRGLIAITALRLVPLAPFALEGALSGAIGIRLWHFMLGSALGMFPGTLAATVFSGQLKNALGESGKINWGLLTGMLVLLFGGAWIVRRWFIRQIALVEREERLQQAPAAAA